MDRTEQQLEAQLRQRLETLHARAFLVDDRGSYLAGVEDAAAEVSGLLEDLEGPGRARRVPRSG